MQLQDRPFSFFYRLIYFDIRQYTQYHAFCSAISAGEVHHEKPRHEPKQKGRVQSTACRAGAPYVSRLCSCVPRPCTERLYEVASGVEDGQRAKETGANIKPFPEIKKMQGTRWDSNQSSGLL